MSKREFLAKLREYLSYELPEQLVRTEVQYYSDYIDSESAGGRSAESVIDELGDPQLIARTVIDAKKSGPDGIPGSADDIDYSGDVYGRGSNRGFGADDDRSSFGQNGYGQSTSGESSGAYDTQGQRQDFGGNGIHVYNMGCFSLILGMLVFFCIFSVIGAVIGALSPVLIPVCMVMLIMWLLGRTGRGGR